MQIKSISTTQREWSDIQIRPTLFSQFVGQEEAKKVLDSAIQSAIKRQASLGHVLFAWQSGYGKTTLAQIVATQMGKQIKIITGYALSKPADLISVLNTLQEGDILFIDEIHRLKPTLEEVLYIAMEDFVIDMVMPEWGNVRVPLSPFTLIGATTKLELLSAPLKNRFVYKFHFMEYTAEERMWILQRYLDMYGIRVSPDVLVELSSKIEGVPREIHNFVIKLRDYLVAHHEHMEVSHLTQELRNDFIGWVQIDEGGLTSIHKRYLEILETYDLPVGVKTIAMKLGINERSVEDDIEPLLLKLGKIDKTSRWRVKN